MEPETIMIDIFTWYSLCEILLVTKKNTIIKIAFLLKIVSRQTENILDNIDRRCQK